MASFSIPNVQIEGIVACVPKTIQTLKECECLSEEDAEKLTQTTGIEERRIAPDSLCTSDLCFAAAEKLVGELGWLKEDNDALIFVTQTPDYVLPSTSPILQERLGLRTNCFSLDISLGCSGYVSGMITLGHLISSGNIKKGLLLVGDTVSKICSPLDKSTYPLFGDAGSATAISYNLNANPITANMFSDGKGYRAIVVDEGGARNPIHRDSLKPKLISEGISRAGNQLALEGMDVFSFGITKAPDAIKQLLSSIELTIEDVDYFIFHQANLLMNEKIRKKLAIPEEKVPYTLKSFGNTSCATIPLTIAVALNKKIVKNKIKMVLCGFGVGLSWGSIYIDTGAISFVEMIEI